MEFKVTREHTFATSSTRSRCEWLLKNSRMINDWNTVVEQILLEKQKPKRKRKRKIQKNVKVVSLSDFTQTLEDERAHRDRIMEDHNANIREINEELQVQREKSASTLKLAYLLRLEIAKQKAVIAEQSASIAKSETKMESVKVEVQMEIKQELKETKTELAKIQNIFLQQQEIMREMQNGTITDVKETKMLLNNLQLQTSDLIEMQRVHENALETKLRSIEVEKQSQIEELKRELEESKKLPEVSPEPTPKSTPETSDSSDSDESEESVKVSPITLPEPEKAVSVISSASSVVHETTQETVKTNTLTLPIGTKVLARLTDEANDGWFYRVTIVSAEGSKYRVDSGDSMLDVSEFDIVKIQGSDVELKREDTVVAKHPNYQSTYAPGVVVKVCSDKVYQVRFYDGTEGLISKAETHHVQPAKFEKIVDFILNLEQRWIGETIIARDDRSGIYKLASVKDRLGSGHEYLVEWNEDSTSSIQHLSCIFGKYSKQRTLQVGDHVISCPNDDTLYYYPGIIRAITVGKLEIHFINESSTSDGKVTESFWVPKEYFDLAKEYYYTQLEADSQSSRTSNTDQE